MSHPSKRRAARSPSPRLPLHYVDTTSDSDRSAPSIFRVRAHEATLVQGHDLLARQTETPQKQIQGGRMARWVGSTPDREVWIDRYDILNLIPSLPSETLSRSNLALDSSVPPTRDEDRGFSDLGSDHEEEFYFRQLPLEEKEEFDKLRKRRKLERGREERMRLLELREKEAQEQQGDNTGCQCAGEEETEPSESQLAMMKKLHDTLANAQNPSLLELRILTNHSNDPKFQFLKKGGKWRLVWERIRSGEVVQCHSRTRREEEKAKPPVGGSGHGGLAGLGNYGSSDSEVESESADEDEDERDISEETGSRREEEGRDERKDAAAVQGKQDEVTQGSELTTSKLDTSPTSRDAEEEQKRKLAKAKKVKEWAQKRKEARGKQPEEG